jgi:hypothetical protein
VLDSKRLHHFLATDPIFTRLLQKSTAAEQARGKLNRYFARIDQRLLDQSDASDSFAIEQQRQCIATMRMFISRRSEQATNSNWCMHCGCWLASAPTKSQIPVPMHSSKISPCSAGLSGQRRLLQSV